MESLKTMHIKRFVAHLLTFRHTAYFTIRFFRRPFHGSRREHRKSSDKPPPVGGGSRDGLLYVFYTAGRSLLRCAVGCVCLCNKQPIAHLCGVWSAVLFYIEHEDAH